MNREEILHNSKDQAARIAGLEQRLKRLAADKSQLQLFADLINRLSLAKGLDDVSSQLVTLLMGTLGGTNITLFYVINGIWYSVDAMGIKTVLSGRPEGYIQKALEKKENIFLDGEGDTHVLAGSSMSSFRQGATWIIPLSAEVEAVGAIKMEGMLVVRPEMIDHLKSFINYASIVLKSEIENYSEIKTAYDRVKAVNKKLIREVEERKSVESELKENELKFRTFFEHVTDYALVLEPSEEGLTIVDMNELACKKHGYTRAEMVGQKITFLDVNPVPPGDKRVKAIMTGKAVNFEVTHRKKDGSTFPVDITCKLIEVEGKPYIFTIERDITARKKAEKDKLTLKNQLQQAQKMEAIGTLAGGIAHDFNNILAAILGYTEMAMEDCPQGTTVTRDLEQVLKATQRAKYLVKQILAFSRQAQVERFPIKIQSLVKEGLKMLRSSIPTTISISQDIDSESGAVLADPTQLIQIIMNLCTNAYHAMAETGGELAVSLKTIFVRPGDLAIQLNLPPGEYIDIAVTDTGAGIGPDVIDKIFDPYFTTKEIGAGTGMGLSIIHGIMKDCNGTITVASKLGKGSTFHVYFPVVQDMEVGQVKAQGNTPQGREQILFVDDEKILAELGKDMLERLGYSVTVRHSSLEALEIFQNDPYSFDVVITDQTMPGMTGSDLSRRMLQIRPDIPIILCTGYSATIDECSAKVIGIKEFALKPLTKDAIARLLRKVLDK